MTTKKLPTNAYLKAVKILKIIAPKYGFDIESNYVKGKCFKLNNCLVFALDPYSDQFKVYNFVTDNLLYFDYSKLIETIEDNYATDY